jgi:DNA-binding SARP family transcriptional activator
VDDFVFRYQPNQGEQLYVVKATLFGTPEVFVNGTKIPDTEWKTKKVKGILEYLILNNGKTVSKDTLLNIFWPDSDSKSAMVSLRTALYQLRKTLSKYQVPVSGNNAFIHETLGGLQIRNSEILELDIAEFLRLQQELAALSEKTGSDSDAILELLEQMVSIYRGDLMEYSDYGDLVFLERERCKMIFEDICLKLGFIYEKRGKLSQAESIFRHALVLEPYSEKICLELLQLLMGQGRRSKAVSLYYRFKKRFEQDLDINIDSRLTEAVRNPGLHK